MTRKKEVIATAEKSLKPPKAASRKPKVTAATAKSEDNTVTTISPTERHSLIAQNAYFLAEKRGFSGGDPVQDWLLAEKEVDQYLKQMRH